MTFWKRSRSSETQKGPVVGEVIISFNFFLRSNLGRCNNRGTRLCLPKHKIRLSAICATSIVCSLIVDKLKLKMQKHDHIKYYEFIVALKHHHVSLNYVSYPLPVLKLVITLRVKVIFLS